MSKEKKVSKVTTLDTAYAKKQYAEYQKQQKQVIFRRRRLAVVFVIVAIIFSGTCIRLYGDYQKLQSLEAAQVELETQVKEQKAVKSELKREIALLQDDEYVGKVARSRLYYSKEGEQIYTIPQSTETTKTTESQSSDD